MQSTSRCVLLKPVAMALPVPGSSPSPPGASAAYAAQMRAEDALGASVQRAVLDKLR